MRGYYGTLGKYLLFTKYLISTNMPTQIKDNLSTRQHQTSHTHDLQVADH